jgi:hypothetical protein
MIGLATGLLGAAAALFQLSPPPRIWHDQPLRDRVALTVTSDRSSYYVGETVRLTLTLQNVSDAPVLGAFTPEVKSAVYYRRGSAPFQLLAHLFQHRGFPISRLMTLDPDAKLGAEVKIAYDPTSQLPLLNEQGEYEFRARYYDMAGANGLLESNVLRVFVADVLSDQREALAAYRQGLAFFAEFHPALHNATPAQIQAAADFLERFRGSLYWKDVLEGLWAAVGERVQAKVASESEEALLKKIREEWADSTPPTLSLSPTPSSLWPPNHKLVPVTITVNVTDDQDPGPEVRLVSITCDDTCNPVQDITGATLNTDDRDFELRAERLGAGTGRTYTITYEASDASGNKATATTTVTVPHDQGVAKKK